MKRICLALAFIVSTLHAQTINLSSSTEASTHPRIISKGGSTYVFWAENGVQPAIHFKMLRNGVWSGNKAITAAGAVTLSSVCAEDSSTLHIAWIDGGGKNNRLMAGVIKDLAVTDSAEVFRDTSALVGIGSCFYQRTNSTQHLVWDVSIGRDSVATFHSSRTGAGVWSQRDTVVPIHWVKYSYPTSQLVEDKNHELACLFFMGDSIRMFRKVSEKWIEGTPLKNNSGGGIGRSFAAANDDSLNIHIVSLPASVATCPCNSMYYAKWDGERWSEAERVPINPYNGAYYNYHTSLGISCSKEGYPVITYEQQRTDIAMRLYNKVIGTSVRTSAGWHVNDDIGRFLESPAAAVDRDNSILYAWQDSSGGNYDIYYRRTSLLTSVEDTKELMLPEKATLYQNFPNPFNPSTTIAFRLTSPATVALKIYDVLGREVASLFSGMLPAGDHRAVWDASGRASGIYYYRMRTEHFAETRKLLLLR